MPSPRRPAGIGSNQYQTKPAATPTAPPPAAEAVAWVFHPDHAQWTDAGFGWTDHALWTTNGGTLEDAFAWRRWNDLSSLEPVIDGLVAHDKTLVKVFTLWVDGPDRTVLIARDKDRLVGDVKDLAIANWAGEFDTPRPLPDSPEVAAGQVIAAGATSFVLSVTTAHRSVTEASVLTAVVIDTTSDYLVSVTACDEDTTDVLHGYVERHWRSWLPPMPEDPQEAIDLYMSHPRNEDSYATYQADWSD